MFLVGAGAKNGEKKRINYRASFRKWLSDRGHIKMIQQIFSFSGKRQGKSLVSEKEGKQICAAEQADEKVLKSTMLGRNFDRALKNVAKGLRGERCLFLDKQ